MTTGWIDYTVPLGDDEVELTLRITYERSPGYAGDRIDPPEPESYEWIKAELVVTEARGTRKRYINVSEADSIVALLDKAMEGDELPILIAEDWERYGNTAPDPDRAYDEARDRQLMADD